MKSRQSILQAFTNKTFDFNKTDEINICAQINQASLNWALNKIPSNTLNRYLNKGKNLVVTDDSPVSTGFKWVTTQLVKIFNIKIKLLSRNNSYECFFSLQRFLNKQ